MNSLWTKLLAAFMLVAFVSVGTVALLAFRTTEREFGYYMQRGGQMRAQQWRDTFEDYYSHNKSWAGVESVFRSLRPPFSPGGMMGMMGMMGNQVILVNTQGEVMADSANTMVGKRLPKAALSSGVPVTVGGRQVGTIVVDPGMMEPLRADSLEQDYLKSISRSLLLAGALGGLIALALSLIIAYRVTSPVRAMTKAVHQISGGNLQQRVQVSAQDEIGELAAAFNTMAANLARTEQLRRNLVADVAHELRTPLAVLQGNLEALMDGVVEPTPQVLASLHEETLLLSRLVADLQELSLAEAGQLQLELQPTDLRGLVEKTVQTIQPQASEKQVGLRVEPAEGLPPVKVDPDRIAQVLYNLISNAIRYSPPGSVVSVSAQLAAQEAPPFQSSGPSLPALRRRRKPQTQAARFVKVTVRDQGSAPADLPCVFERFYQADRSRTRNSGGAGIGLAIVKQLVEAHKGRVGVESEVGRGSSFWFTIPVGD